MKCYSERVAHGGRCVCVGGGECVRVGWGGVGWGVLYKHWYNRNDK